MSAQHIKILTVSDAWTPQINGVVRTYEHINEELLKDSHAALHVIGPADFPRRFKMPGYAEIELVITPYRRLARMINSLAPDHIHIATEGPLGVAARKYCLKNGRAFTTAYHTHFPDYAAKRAAKFLPFLEKPVRNFFIGRLRKFHNAAGGVMIATQSLEDELRSWGFNAPFYRLSRGVIPVFTNEGQKAALPNNLPSPRALYVGRVAVEKNLGAFLDMDWTGSKIIVGQGPDLDMLRRKYPQALFTGKKVGVELAEYFRAADLFVFPSRTDTFGMVLVEALASGLPVAAYPVTGPRDIITEPLLGALDEDLSIAAQKALAAEGTAQERHDYATAHYSWPAVAQQFLNAIKEVEASAAAKKA